MNTPEPIDTANVFRARRAIGAMFLSAFGSAWLAIWVYDAFNHPTAALVLIGVLSGALFWFAYLRFLDNRSALKAEAGSPVERRTSRNFNIVNAVQWVTIVIAANILANVGLSVWIIPMIIFVVGGHFLPLARVFDYRPHYLTGGGLMLVAVAYPMLAPSGPHSPIGCLGAGLILWGSALWAVTANPAIERTA